MHLRNKPIKLISVICSHYVVVLLQHLICPLEFSFSHSMTFIKRLHSKYLCQFDACKTFEPCKKNSYFFYQMIEFVSLCPLPHHPFFFFALATRELKRKFLLTYRSLPSVCFLSILPITQFLFLYPNINDSIEYVSLILTSLK